VRVALLDSRAPFAVQAGGHAAQRLCHALREHGHEALVVELPFCAAPAAQIVDQMLAMRLVHLNGVELTVGLRFPAYLVPHHDMALWPLADGSAALRGAGHPGAVRASVLAAERALDRTATLCAERHGRRKPGAPPRRGGDRAAPAAGQPGAIPLRGLW
jgi:hypothetical protein